ncbi:uncharacterized protein [Spinacia oleracea]|uniref:Uncharacterized protein n=1 Tax=Spinacia oleracea TaxID=3562 RepID=A0ABM3R1W0_SPIOL|nr:uncharacterized protein LOC130464150 [Spinacia oleracea]
MKDFAWFRKNLCQNISHSKKLRLQRTHSNSKVCNFHQILRGFDSKVLDFGVFLYDESRSQELIERKIHNSPPEQGTVKVLTLEEWEEIREVRPVTPFGSKLARSNARIRIGGVVKKKIRGVDRV